MPTLTDSTAPYCLHSSCTAMTTDPSGYCAGHRPYMRPADCPDQQPDETARAYQGRVLRYAVRYPSLEGLSPAQLEIADTAAQHAVCALPKDLSPTDHHLDRQLSALRHRIAARVAHRRATLARLQRMIDQMDPNPSPDGDAPEGQPDQAEGHQETDADRAAKLLRAALTLIMGNGNGDQGGGGRGARLIRPVPQLPPGGQALQVPTLTTRPGLTPGQPVQPFGPTPTRRTPADDIDF